MHDLLLPAISFVLGCLLIHAGRAHAQATTVLLSVTAVTLSLTAGGMLVDRLAVPSGSAEAGELYCPRAAQAIEVGQ